MTGTRSSGRPPLAIATAIAIAALGLAAWPGAVATAAAHPTRWVSRTATDGPTGATAAAAGHPAPARQSETDPATPYEDLAPYYEVSPTGAVWPLGGATPFGQLAAATLHTTVVSATLTPDHRGYWLVTAAGGVYNFGDAVWYGSPRRMGMVPEGLVADGDGGGYWVYGRGGLVAAYGDARLLGRVHRPVVDMVAGADSDGYWMVDAAGVVTAVGKVRWFGDERAERLPHPIVAMAPTPDGLGYWLVSVSGNVFSHGDAAFEGSLARHPIDQPIASILPTPDGLGYWLVAHDGDLYPFGDATSMAPPPIIFVHRVLTAGDRAVEWAMGEIGQPYLWGGTGPGGFDCSGLTMESWLAAGVSIPRVAADQFHALPKVALRNLVDGDLVFWSSTARWQSIYHVGLYLGGGHMVDAPYTGQVVRSDWIGGPQFVEEGAAPS